MLELLNAEMSAGMLEYRKLPACKFKEKTVDGALDGIMKGFTGTLASVYDQFDEPTVPLVVCALAKSKVNEPVTRLPTATGL